MTTCCFLKNAHANSINSCTKGMFKLKINKRLVETECIITASYDKLIKMWTFYKQRFVLYKYFSNSHQSYIPSIDLNKECTLLVSCSINGLIVIWNMPACEIRKTIQIQAELWSVAFQFDGRSIVTGTQKGSMNIIDIETGSTVKREVGLRGSLVTVACSPDGECIAAGCSTGRFKLFRNNSYRTNGVVYSNRACVTKIAFSLDSKYVYLGLFTGKIDVYDVSDFNFVDFSHNHSAPISGIEFSPNNTHFLSGSRDSRLILWHIKNMVQIHSFRQTLVLTSVMFYDEGKKVVACAFDGSIQIFNTPTRINNEDIF